jgi:hypothetical protein
MVIASAIPFFVAGVASVGADEVIVRHPYDGREVGRTSHATPAQIEHAIAAAADVAFETALPCVDQGNNRCKSDGQPYTLPLINAKVGSGSSTR